MASSSAPSATVCMEKALARLTTADTTWRLEASCARSQTNSPVDLEERDGEPFQISETAVASTEVVKGNLAPHLVETMDKCLRGRGVSKQCRLGDLAHNDLGPCAVGLEGGAHDREHVGVHDRLGREVELHGIALGCQTGSLIHHPPVDLRDQPELFGCREEAIREGRSRPRG